MIHSEMLVIIVHWMPKKLLYVSKNDIRFEPDIELYGKNLVGEGEYMPGDISRR